MPKERERGQFICEQIFWNRTSSCINLGVHRTIFKVIRDSFGIALLHFLIGPEKSRLFLNQSNSKFKPIATWSPAFSRASGCSVVLLWVITGFLFTFFCFDWLLLLLWVCLFDLQSKCARWSLLLLVGVSPSLTFRSLAEIILNIKLWVVLEDI